MYYESFSIVVVNCFVWMFEIIVCSCSSNKKKGKKMLCCFDFSFSGSVEVKCCFMSFLTTYEIMECWNLSGWWKLEWIYDIFSRPEMYLQNICVCVCVLVCVCILMCMCECVCACVWGRKRQRSSCLTIDWPAIGCCSHMSKKGWTMYPWCSTCWWTSRSWSLSLVCELPLSGSQVRTL